MTELIIVLAIVGHACWVKDTNDFQDIIIGLFCFVLAIIFCIINL